MGSTEKSGKSAKFIEKSVGNFLSVPLVLNDSQFSVIVQGCSMDFLTPFIKAVPAPTCKDWMSFLFSSTRPLLQTTLTPNQHSKFTVSLKLAGPHMISKHPV